MRSLSPASLPTKACTKCGEVKPFAEFHRDRTKRGGHAPWCRACKSTTAAAKYARDPESGRESGRRWRQQNPERAKVVTAEWRGRNRDRVEATRNAWYEQNRERLRAYDATRKMRRRATLLHQYGLTLGDYDRMLERQSGGCAQCGAPPPHNRHLHVDHDAQTGRVRGLLCHHHNVGMGHFHHSIDELQAAIDYLRANQGVVMSEQHVLP